MIHSAPEALHLDLDRVNLAIVCGWGERDAVLVADELRNFRVRAVEFLLVFGEVDASASGLRELIQLLIGLRKDLLHPAPILALLGGEFPALRRFAEITRE